MEITHASKTNDGRRMTGEITNLCSHHRQLVENVLKKKEHSIYCPYFEDLEEWESNIIFNCLVQTCNAWSSILGEKHKIYYFYSSDPHSQASAISLGDGNYCVVLYQGLQQIPLIAYDDSSEQINLANGIMGTAEFVVLQIQTIYLYLVHHEIGHIVHGHLGIIASAGLNIIDEKVEPTTDSAATFKSHYFELDADAFAVSQLLQILFNGEAPKEASKLDVIVGALLNAFRHFYGKEGGLGLSIKTYPRPSTRWSLAIEAFHKTKFGPQQRSMSDELIERAQSGLWLRVSELNQKDRAIFEDLTNDDHMKEFDTYAKGLEDAYKVMDSDLRHNKLWGNTEPIFKL